MPTTLTNGIQLPDKGSVDWYSSMQSNYNLIDTHLGDTDVHVTAEDKANWNSKQGSLSQDQLDAIAQVATNTDDIATLQSGKADASHTHSSSDITDIDDYATKDYVDNSISGLVDNAPDALNTLNELSAALNDDSNFASTVTTALAAKADSADLATVATSGSYTDLTDKPTINDSTITIQKNGSTVDTFTTNGSAKTINIPVPTKTSDLTNDSDFIVSSSLATVATSGFYNDLDNKPYIPDKISDLIDDSNFVDTSNPAVSSGITSAKVTDYDTHIADTDIHVTTADKNRWNNQTYVFRYSSTALTASSTNSNTLLDNTDNLKVGDKVIDSSGVLFSITAIDTANSTFTIGTALIDLLSSEDVGAVALSNNYNDLDNLPTIPTVNNATLTIQKNGVDVQTFTANASSNVTCNVTVPTKTSELTNDSGFLTSHQSLSSCVKNVVTNNQTIKSTDIIRGTAPSSAQTFGIAFSDNNNKYIGNIYGQYATDKSTYVGLYAYKGTTTANSDNVSVRVGYDASGNAYTYAPTPATTDNSTQIATTAFVKAQDSNVVHKSGDETVAGQKTLVNLLPLKGEYLGSEASNNGRSLLYFLANRDTQNQSGIFLTKFRQNKAQGAMSGNDVAYLSFDCLENSVRTNNGLRINFLNFVDDIPQRFILWSGITERLLGTASAPWSDVSTDKINGLNPSSLSLPDLNNGIDISSYLDTSQSSINYYTPSVNGWISIKGRSGSTSGITIIQDGMAQMGYTLIDFNSSDRVSFCSLPVKGGVQVEIWLKSVTTLDSAKFYPCQGNV